MIWLTMVVSTALSLAEAEAAVTVVRSVPATALLGIATVRVTSALFPGDRVIGLGGKIVVAYPWLLTAEMVKVSAVLPVLVTVCM
jgi:hypothetical protein